MQRWALHLSGIVQGIGLRPLIYRLSCQYQLTGWVKNTDQEVILLWQGLTHHLELAINELKTKLHIYGELNIKKNLRKLKKEKFFKIQKSYGSNACHSLICPDIAVCNECLNEVFDPVNYRYQYPFITCTQCGPRYTICNKLPYDRQHTSMNQFSMCQHCRNEYTDPFNRRFHAQTISCWHCGPKLWLSDQNGNILTIGSDAIKSSSDALLAGKIVAVKGIGGFHLMVLANDPCAIERLRTLKQRPHKPFALMVKNIEQALSICDITEIEMKALNMSASPIVILQKKQGATLMISESVAPQQANYGIMLAYTPLHHLLLAALPCPVIATSANLKEDPICFKNEDALDGLKNIADLWLCHDREIYQPLEDSVVQIINHKIQYIRKARGFIPFSLKTHLPHENIIAVGGHLKNTIACQKQDKIYISSFIGDLNSKESLIRFDNEINKFLIISNQNKIVCDLHPEYASTLKVQKDFTSFCSIQHHQSHIFSVMAEHQLSAPLLGFAWDGIGFGSDGNLWGCESFLVGKQNIEHIATLLPFSLPAVNSTIKEPRRMALSLLYSLYGDKIWEQSPNFIKQYFSTSEQKLIPQLIKNSIQIFTCTSIGRLFDAIACILGGIPITTFEGQAAMYLQQLAQTCSSCDCSYPVTLINENDKLIIDWRSMLHSLLDDLNKKINKARIAYQFHDWCKNVICQIADRVDCQKIILNGGVFQNKLLTEMAYQALIKKGYQVYCAEKLPPNDSGLALGQIYAMHHLNYVFSHTR